MAKTEHHSFRVANPNSNYRSDIHVYGPNQDAAYDIQLKGAIKSNGGQENRSAKDYSNVILSKGVAEKMRKYRINLNDVRRAGAHDDGVFNECKISDQESDDDIASINSKDNGDDAYDDDDADDDDD